MFFTSPSKRSRGTDRKSEAVEAFQGNGPEERGHADLVVHDDPGGAAADGIHSRQVGGGQFQPLLDVLEVVGGIRLQPRIPGQLRAEDGLSVHHRRHLVVTGAQIETDAAAFQMAAQGQGLTPGRRHLVRRSGDHLERTTKGPAHEFGVEGPEPTGNVLRRQGLPDARRATQGGLPAAAGPEEEIEHPAHVFQVVRVPTRILGKDLQVQPGDAFRTLLQADAEAL